MERAAGPGSPPPAGAPRARLFAGRLALAVFPVLLMALHTYTWSLGFAPASVTAWRRMWSDLAVAIGTHVDATEGPPRGLVAGGAEADRTIRRYLLLRFQDGTLDPARPLKTVSRRDLAARRIAATLAPYDDKGRSSLLALAFRLRGGVAPFLLLWLGFAVAAPLVAWTAVELHAAGWRRAAFAVPLLLGTSPFLVQSLALPRYPVGFYLAAVLAVLPLAAYAALRERPALRGLAVRAAAAGAVLAVCVFCRSSAATLMPAFVLAVVAGVVRAGAGRRGLGVAALAAATFFALPAALVPGGQQHDVWQPVWEGLGDFDRTHGFTWNDDVAEEVVRAEAGAGLWTRESEQVFRRQVLDAVAGDPLWYGGILARRLASTVSLWKLWPWGPLDGQFLRLRTSPNEGVIDKYWTYTDTLDHVGLGPATREVPVLLILAPALVLAGLAVRSRWRDGARRALLLLACPAAGTLVLPVLITTAGGQEAQSFGLVYLLAAGLLPDVLAKRA